MNVDLHSHTIYSDGDLTPEQIISEAAKNGLEAIAITDHDTIRGLERARQAARAKSLILIPGVEITTLKYHILGLCFNPGNTHFQDFLRYSQALQREKTRRRVRELQKREFPITLEMVESRFPESRLGKMNLARTLMADPACLRRLYQVRMMPVTIEWIVHDYLKDNGYLGEPVAVAEKDAIEEIHAAGGKAILAHPSNEIKNTGEINPLIEWGLDGIELQPRLSYKDGLLQLKDYAKSRGLIVTTGSDYHGESLTRKMLTKDNNNGFSEQDLKRLRE